MSIKTVYDVSFKALKVYFLVWKEKKKQKKEIITIIISKLSRKTKKQNWIEIVFLSCFKFTLSLKCLYTMIWMILSDCLVTWVRYTMTGLVLCLVSRFSWLVVTSVYQQGSVDWFSLTNLTVAIIFSQKVYPWGSACCRVAGLGWIRTRSGMIFTHQTLHGWWEPLFVSLSLSFEGENGKVWSIK